MAADRYVVLGLARARAAWFGEVARWATAAALPIDFVKAVSAEEVRTRLRSGRPFSALLVDGRLPALDRDLVELAGQQRCAVIAVDDGRSARPWRELGVAAVLPAEVERGVLLDALRAVAQPIARSDDLTVPAGPVAPEPVRWRGRSVAVTGSGGVGCSTLAMALAAGLAADPRDHGLVVLADLALHAQQALLHDAGDVVPGVVELADGHRGTALEPAAVRDLCFSMPRRGYDLLLGLRRQRDWTALRPRALTVGLDGLRRAYRVVVSDVDADVEGEAECGSVDVEDRNLLARTALREAEIVLVVGHPGLAGVHAQLRVVRDLVEVGVAGERIVPVVNRAPRNPRQRAELGTTLARLLAAACPGVLLASTPVFVPERRRLDELLRDGAALPPPIVRPVTGAVRALLDRTPEPPPPPPAPEPVAVVPGSLGSWAADGDADAFGDQAEA
jgi:MinD-like ATPase involved in chromosome partitioning or flagellar assembly